MTQSIESGKSLKGTLEILLLLCNPDSLLKVQVTSAKHGHNPYTCHYTVSYTGLVCVIVY